MLQNVFPQLAASPSDTPLCRFALDAARDIRDDLKKLYSLGAGIVGELRYDFLWHMSRLERICATLERSSAHIPADRWDRAYQHGELAKLARQGLEIRQDAHAVISEFRQEHRHSKQAEQLAPPPRVRKTTSNNSIRAMAAAFF
jgi:hypothetical protein